MLRSLVIAILLLPIPLAAQVAESIEVRVVTVDVVVTDKSGKPVTGLTADDFEVLEEGKRQKITHFSEVRADAGVQTTQTGATTTTSTTVEARPRRFLLFVDNHSLHPTVRAEVVESLGQFVDKHLGPRDEASVVSWNRALKIITPFTSDKALLHAGIKTVDTIGSVNSVTTPLVRVQQRCMRAVDAVRSGRMGPRAAYDECILAAREHTEEVELTSRQLMGAINVTLNTLTGFEGKRVLVLAGAQLPVKPGLETYQWVNQLFMPLMRGFDAAIDQPDDVGKVQNLAIETLAKSANAHGVTLYLIAAALPGEPNTVATMSATSDAGADFLQRQNTATAYNTLADLTGGISVTRNSKLDLVLDAIVRDLDSYYSLGYRPAEAFGKDRTIAVKTKEKSYTVRSRKTWSPKSSDDNFGDRVIANVFTPAPKSDFEVRLKTEKPRKQGDNFVVPIEVTFPPALTLLPDAEGLSGGFTFSVAVGNPLGGLSTVFRQPEGITIKREELTGFRQTPITYTASLTIKKGESLISVGILDQVGRTAGFARTTIVAE